MIRLKPLVPLVLLTCAVHAQTAPKPSPLAPLSFLFGTWNATTTPAGTAKAQSLGTYTFQLDLNGNVVTRTGSLDKCSGPANFDCEHHDMLTIYLEDNKPHAIYFDNEGHTIHYDLIMPDASTAVFVSNTPGPHFRLTYHFDGMVMTGRFQFAPPNSTEFTSYLEWSEPGNRFPWNPHAPIRVLW